MAFEQPVWKSKVKWWNAVVTRLSVVMSGVRTHNRLETINGLSTTSQVAEISVTYILFFNASSQRKQILVWLILLSHNSFCHTIFSYLNKSDSVKIISKRKKNSPQFWKTFASILPVNSYQNLLNLLSVIKIIIENKLTVYYLCL